MLCQCMMLMPMVLMLASFVFSMSMWSVLVVWLPLPSSSMVAPMQIPSGRPSGGLWRRQSTRTRRR